VVRDSWVSWFVDRARGSWLVARSSWFDPAPLLKLSEVDPRGGVHEAGDVLEPIRGRGGDVNAGSLRVAERIEVQPEIEVGIEFGFELSGRQRRLQQPLGRRQAAQQVIQLGHRHPGVRHDREHRVAGFAGGFGAGDADEIPGHVLGIGRVDRAMGGELLRAFLVASLVIESDTTLP